MYSTVAEVGDEGAIVIDRKAPWILELAWLITLLAELGHERAAAIFVVAREYLHSMIFGIHDEQETSMMVEHQASRRTQQTIGIAWLLGADRELDSSIAIKRIVFHLVEELRVVEVAIRIDQSEQREMILLARHEQPTNQESEGERATKQVSKQREASGASPPSPCSNPPRHCLVID